MAMTPQMGAGGGILRRLLNSEYLVLLLSLVYFLVLLPFTPGLASWENLVNMFSRMLPLLVAAVGLTVVLITGGIDLSITSILALTSVLGAQVMTQDGGLLAGSRWAVPAGLAVMLGAGVALGGINGLAVTVLRMPAFMVTLTTMMFLSGLAIWLTQSRNIAQLPGAFILLGRETWTAALVALAVVMVAHLALSRSLYGRWWYAIGHNAQAARISGVPVDQAKLAAYMGSGLCAALAAVLISGRLETGSPVHGREILLDIVGATVIGGTSLLGGKGKVQWTVFGVMFLTLIDTSLNLLSLSDFAVRMVKGAVILLAAVIDAVRNPWTLR